MKHTVTMPAWVKVEIDAFKDIRSDEKLARITASLKVDRGITQVMFHLPGSGRKAWITHFNGGKRRNDWSVTKAYSEDALHSDNTIRGLKRSEAVEQAIWHLI